MRFFAPRRRQRYLPAIAGTFLLLLMSTILAACGGGSHHRLAQAVVTHATPAPAQSCPQALLGHGHPGICAPKSNNPTKALGTPPRMNATAQNVIYPDRSNNNPCACGLDIRANGYRGLIVKGLQGTNFIDRTAHDMIVSARAAHLAVGLYDFDATYSLAEAHLFVQLAREYGLLPSSHNTFPLYFDVEFGAFSYSRLVDQIRYVQSQGYRVGIYTGKWYWDPHASCQWPAGVTGWISGYPIAPAPCGMPLSLFQAHQFTDSPTDLTLFGHATGPSTFVADSPASFAAFTNGHVKPTIHSAQFAIYPLRYFRIEHHKISERRNVVRWRAHGCKNPAHRHVCVVTHRHLELLAARLHHLALARHNRLCINVANCGPIWSNTPYHWSVRHYRIERILHSHHK